MFSKFSLGSRGISHVLIPGMVVVVMAVAGTFMLVSSHEAPNKVRAYGAIVSAPVSGPKKQKSVVSVILFSSNKDGYALIASLLDRKGKPVSQANCNGTLDIGIIAKSTTTMVTSTNGVLPVWDGSTCKYTVPINSSYVTSSTDKKGNVRLKVSIQYRGSATLHQYKKNLTLKRIWL